MAPLSLTNPVEVPQYCPACGYDQRGLPSHVVCPECGQPQSPEEAARVNQWVDHALVDLWGIAALQVVGIMFGSAAWVFVALGHYMAGLVVAGAFFYMFAATVWFAIIAVGYMRRRAGPNFRNVTVWRRRQLSRWLGADLLLVVGPLIIRLAAILF